MGNRGRFKADKDLSFDDAMSQLGVRPLERKSPTNRKKSARSVPKQNTSAKQHGPPSVPSTTSDVQRLQALQRDHQDVQDRLTLLRAEHQQTVARLQQLQDEHLALKNHASVLQDALDDQRMRLAAAQHTPSAASEQSLRTVLGSNGIKGDDEAAFVFRALLDARMMGGLLSRLHVPQPQRLSAWLSENLSLLCEEHHSLSPTGKAVLTVPAARCEVCGGQNVAQAVWQYHDALLIHGLTRITIAGGTLRQHRMLKPVVAHSAIRHHFVPHIEHRSPSLVALDAQEADLIVLWRQGCSEETMAMFQQAQCMVLQVQQDTVIAILQAVSKRIQQGSVDQESVGD